MLLIKSLFLKSDIDTETLAATLAKVITSPCIIFLEGPLGAGKTTFLRGFLRALGFSGHVKSPTFTLLETYSFNQQVIVHMDLYRLKNAAELEMIGFRDYLTDDAIFVIEWPKKVENQLPKPSLLCNIKIPANGLGRVFEIQLFPPVLDSLKTWFEGI